MICPVRPLAEKLRGFSRTPATSVYCCSDQIGLSVWVASVGLSQRQPNKNIPKVNKLQGKKKSRKTPRVRINLSHQASKSTLANASTTLSHKVVQDFKRMPVAKAIAGTNKGIRCNRFIPQSVNLNYMIDGIIPLRVNEGSRRKNHLITYGEGKKCSLIEQNGLKSKKRLQFVNCNLFPEFR